MRNPPDQIKFDATSFCSEFLRPLITDLSIVKVTSPTTTSTSVVISLVYASPVTTKPSIPAKTTALSPTTQPAALITTSPATTLSAPANGLKKRSFTVPEYLEPWYFYGRLDPGCSCIITSADPSILISATETSTFYEFTVSTTVTEVYTIYPGMQ